MRKHLRLTQKQVAEGIGITERHYQDLEYGTKSPSAETLAEISDFYKITADYFLGLGLFAKMDLIDTFFDLISSYIEKLRFPPELDLTQMYKEGDYPKKLTIINFLIADIELDGSNLKIKWKIK